MLHGRSSPVLTTSISNDGAAWVTAIPITDANAPTDSSRIQIR